jgi:hypothetical protein
VQTSDQQRIGDRYELEQTIGTGGMARVYLAHDRTLDREVAVKILTPGLAADPLFVERFRREAQAAAALNHPNIVTIYDTGTTDQTYYIVMEYVPGPNLKEAIRQRGALPEAEALGIGAQVAAALEAAHHRRLIHRDVKSHNVLLHPTGTAKVTDFGIARAAGASQLTATNTVMGTAHYLSPEQALHQQVDGRSDVYSLGIVLYEALSGQLPFAGDSLVSVAMQQVHEQPAPLRTLCPDLSPQTETVVMKALAKNPAERYQSAGEMRAALLRAEDAIHRADRVALVETRPLPPGTPDDTVVRATIPGLPLVASASPPAAPIERQRTQLLPPEHRKRRLAVPLILAAFCALMVGVGLFAFRSLGGGSRATIVSTPTASARASVVAAVTTPSPVPTQAASPLPAATPAPATLVPPTPIPPTAAPALVAPTATVISPTVAPTVAPPTPTPLAVPTATPAPAPTATAIPPTAAPAPTAVPPTEPPPPVATARPSGPVTVANSPAQAVQQFYSFASQRNFDAAAGLWSARMKAEYPPGENLNGHFGALRRVDASTGAAQIDPSGTRATVPVEVIETLDSGATRRLQGSWQLVRGPSGWLLDQPNLIAA